MASFRSKIPPDAAHFARGFLMGGADVIPGVSGGTIALILGIYERLVTAISHVDWTLLTHLRRGRLQQAAAHLDLRFLVALGCGILLGVGSLASVMHLLLDHYPVFTNAALFGLIVAASVIVATMVRRWSAAPFVGLAAGAVFAFWLVGVLPAAPRPDYAYLFMSGVIAICAMILPGISGAFILVILGMYFHVTGVLKDFLHGDLSGKNLLTILVFASGCGVGLLTFSKALRWLLARHGSMTMAVLGGFMVGSLRKIWPFKEDVTLQHLNLLPLSPEEIETLRESPEKLATLQGHYHIYRNTLPESFTSEVLLAAALAIGCMLLVLGLDYLVRRQREGITLRAADHEPDAAASP